MEKKINVLRIVIILIYGITRFWNCLLFAGITMKPWQLKQKLHVLLQELKSMLSKMLPSFGCTPQKQVQKTSSVLPLQTQAVVATSAAAAPKSLAITLLSLSSVMDCHSELLCKLYTKRNPVPKQTNKKLKIPQITTKQRDIKRDRQTDVKSSGFLYSKTTTSLPLEMNFPD